METPLSVKNLTKRYGQFVAVDNISFTIEPGEVFGLLGPNGAGKTTTISCITTLEDPSDGSIKIFGHDNRKEPSLAKRSVGNVPQELIHHGFFNLSEILRFHSSYYGEAISTQQINALLKKVDLYDHRHKLVSHLSGGMKRRLLIAKALVHKPKLILLDEPTAGVDVELRQTLWDLIIELKNEGTSVLLTTHYLEEAEKLCDRVGIIQNGKLIRLGKTGELIESLGKRRITFSLTRPMEPVDHPHLHAQTDAALIFSVPQNYSVSRLLEELNLCYDRFSDISIHEGTLEEVFTSVLQEST